MKAIEITKEIKEKGKFSASNELCGWCAISKEGINMITFFQGKFSFAKNDDKIKFYNEKAFAKKVSSLIIKGY